MDDGAAQTVDLAVVVVTWNNADVIVDALQSLLDDLKSSDLRSQVWLVDSASTDDTVGVVRERFAAVRLIASEENIGFGAGNNLALQAIGFNDEDRAGVFHCRRPFTC